MLRKSGVILLILVLLTGGTLAADLLLNGAMADADANGIPDHWTAVDLLPGDGSDCETLPCWFVFADYPLQNRGIRQVVPLAGMPPTVTLSFRAAGRVTDTAAVSLYVYRGGVLPAFSRTVFLPLNVNFNQVFTLPVALPADASAVQIDIVSPRQGVYRITDVQLNDGTPRFTRQTASGLTFGAVYQH